MIEIKEEKIDLEMVKKVANLSKLEIDEKDLEDFRDQFINILDYFEKLDEVDAEDVKPTSHAMEIINEVREDVVSDEFDNEEALKNASKKEDGYFKGPRVKD